MWCLSVQAATVPDDFKAANQLYDAGRFSEALAAYERIEPKTAAVWYNLGNACFRTGQLGRAELNYERAQRLAPRDPDILANLKFAEQRLGVEELNRPPRALARLIDSVVDSRTLREWTRLELAALWFTVGFVALAVWALRLRTLIVVAALAAGSAWLFCTGVIAHRVFHAGHAPRAIVLVKSSAARFAPLAEATVHFQLTEGTRVKVREDRGAWVFVERADGQQGWVLATTVEKVGVE